MLPAAAYVPAKHLTGALTLSPQLKMPGRNVDKLKFACTFKQFHSA